MFLSNNHCSSTNAYMLMYRQVAPERNAKFLEQHDMPAHIIELVHNLRHLEEVERKRREMERSMCKVQLDKMLHDSQGCHLDLMPSGIPQKILLGIFLF